MCVWFPSIFVELKCEMGPDRLEGCLWTYMPNDREGSVVGRAFLVSLEPETPSFS